MDTKGRAARTKDGRIEQPFVCCNKEEELRCHPSPNGPRERRRAERVGRARTEAVASSSAPGPHRRRPRTDGTDDTDATGTKRTPTHWPAGWTGHSIVCKWPLSDEPSDWPPRSMPAALRWPGAARLPPPLRYPFDRYFKLLTWPVPVLHDNLANVSLEPLLE